ncbi:MAG: PEP-CTERM/exosortase system-associated acyltransferase, partial [Methylotetracoccus sp.]|nr:PEP-CTERM/exosortase system-associated acyltransferase [Methylotetracoccus sp.]
FELTPALDPVSLDQVFRIRHEVYCRDLGWEPLRDDGRESDEFDRHSFHCLLRKRSTGEPVGCTRLIVARPDSPDSLLPFEVSCRDVLDRNLADPAQMPRDTLGEVSRLAVLSTFRRRKGEDATAVSVTDEDFGARGPQSRFPFIPVSLYLGAAAIARRFGIENVFVLTEPRLAKHFVRIGFDIREVGRPIEHRGIRLPSLLSSSKVVAGLRPMIRPLYTVIEEAVNTAFLNHPEARQRMSAKVAVRGEQSAFPLTS